jgi:hypothetical protein
LLVYIFPWESLRVEHTSALRARLVDLVDDATYKPSTSNQHLAALRGILTGLRRAEVAGLDRDDYSISTQEVKIRRSKRRKGRTVYLKAEGPRQALEVWLGFRGDAPGPLFLHIRRGGHIVWRSVLPPTHSDEEALGQVKETPNLQNLKRKSGNELVEELILIS